MYSKDMVLQQSSNNQTIHDRLLSAILMAVSREYITMDQSIGQTKTFKMTPRGLTANLDKILSTEMFFERLSRMAESFYQSSRTTFVPRSKSKLQLVDQAGAEVSSPIRQQNVKLDRQNENDDTQEIAKNTNESARNKIGGIVFKEEKNVASDLQSSHKDNVPDANDTSMIPRVSVGTDSIVAEKIPLNNDSPMDDEEHLSTHARLMNNRKQRGD